jgi:hypothetical protein
VKPRKRASIPDTKTTVITAKSRYDGIASLLLFALSSQRF